MSVDSVQCNRKASRKEAVTSFVAISPVRTMRRGWRLGGRGTTLGDFVRRLRVTGQNSFSSVPPRGCGWVLNV